MSQPDLARLQLQLQYLQLQQRVLISALHRLYAAIRAHRQAKGSQADPVDHSLYCVLQEFEQHHET